jgi:hypothetical protein
VAVLAGASESVSPCKNRKNRVVLTEQQGAAPLIPAKRSQLSTLDWHSPYSKNRDAFFRSRERWL